MLKIMDYTPATHIITVQVKNRDKSGEKEKAGCISIVSDKTCVEIANMIRKFLGSQTPSPRNERIKE